MSTFVLAILVGCSTGTTDDEPVVAEGAPIDGRLHLGDGDVLAVEGQLYSDGSMTVSGSDETVSLDLTVPDASTQVGWWVEEAAEPVQITLTFTSPAESFTEAEVYLYDWEPRDDGRYVGHFKSETSEWMAIELGATALYEYSCWVDYPLYCFEQTFEQFDPGLPEGGCYPWHVGRCPTEGMVGFCEDDSESGGHYYYEGVCDHVEEGPPPGGGDWVSEVSEFCTRDGYTWTEMGEGSCE